jgi:hypothetical protein
LPTVFDRVVAVDNAVDGGAARKHVVQRVEIGGAKLYGRQVDLWTLITLPGATHNHLPNSGAMRFEVY